MFPLYLKMSTVTANSGRLPIFSVAYGVRKKAELVVSFKLFR